MRPLTPHQEIKTVPHPIWVVEFELALCRTTRTGLAEDYAGWCIGEVFEPDITPRMEQALLATCFRIGCGGSCALGSVAARTTVSKVGWIIAGWIIQREQTLGPDMVRLECGRRRGIAIVDVTILTCSVGTLSNMGSNRLRQP